MRYYILISGMTCVFMVTACEGFAGEEKGNALTVCSVLSNIDSYRNKYIVVRGFYNWSTHGWSLLDNYGDEPCTEVMNKGCLWPPGISLGVLYADTERIMKMLANSRHIQREFDNKGKFVKIVATFSGELKTKSDTVIIRKTNGAYVGNGYGLNGRYPAQIIVNDVSDIQIVQ
jgi:hypothetical protein